MDNGAESATIERSIWINPLRVLTFTNPTILFNVLDCTLMDTSSHTSSNRLALSHPYFFPLISAVSLSPGDSIFHSWQYHFQSCGSIILWMVRSRGGDVIFFLTCSSADGSVWPDRSVSEVKMCESFLDEWRDHLGFRCSVVLEKYDIWHNYRSSSTYLAFEGILV